MVQLVEEKVNFNVYSSRNTYTINENVREIKLFGKMVVLDISSAFHWIGDCVSRRLFSYEVVCAWGSAVWCTCVGCFDSQLARVYQA